MRIFGDKIPISSWNYAQESHNKEELILGLGLGGDLTLSASSLASLGSSTLHAASSKNYISPSATVQRRRLFSCLL